MHLSALGFASAVRFRQTSVPAFLREVSTKGYKYKDTSGSVVGITRFLDARPEPFPLPALGAASLRKEALDDIRARFGSIALGGKLTPHVFGALPHRCIG